MINKKIKGLVKSLPKDPGIYFFKDKNNKILYIGKAKNLKTRVSSYFSNKNSSKNLIMISKAVDIETMIVNNEVEALLVESNMIKKYKPKYNITLKDDKSYPYIIITNEDYPKVEIIRIKNLKKNKNTYFGPYTDVNYLRTVLRTLHQIFPIRTCNFLINNSSIKDKRHQICLDYHIEKCEGPCEGLVTKKEYQEMIYNVVRFLKGKNKNVKDTIVSKMNDSSRNRLYEQAAKYRDQLRAIEKFEKKQTKLTQKFNDRDVIHISHKDNYGIAFIMRIRNGLLIAKEKFDIKIDTHVIFEDTFSNFIVQYYKMTMDVPSEIIINIKIKDKNSIEDWLQDKKGKKVRIINPKIGESKKILELCIKNSDLILKNYIFKKIKRKEYIPKTLNELKDTLNMSVVPKRIEAFDNSNLNGKFPVAGMVTFIDGKPRKKYYRHYNIKTVKGIDDFESMREIIYRRYMRVIKEKKQLPDLILIDGGKGQLSAAKSTLDKLGLGYIAIIGLAKKLEEVFLPGLSEPQNISKTSSCLYLLREIRDEVHRFAISFHRKKRKNEFLKSFLDDVKGLGNKRIQIIWNNYNDLSQFYKDPIKNINEKTKLSIKLIKEIKSKIKLRKLNE